MVGQKISGYISSPDVSRISRDLANGHQIDQTSDMLRTAVNRPVSVGIVGAGFAGLRCADVLLQHGFKVTMLEARDRLGGRVAQSNHLGHLADLGPNWIHGASDNPIHDLALKTGTKLHAWEEHESIIDEDGQPLEPEETKEYSELLWDDGLIAAAFKYSNEHHDTIDPARSLYDFFVEETNKLFMDESTAEAARKRKCLLQFATMWGCYIGSPITRQSLKFFWLEECIEGENPFVAGTYQKILQAVELPAKQKAEIKLNHEVTGIVSDDRSQREDGLASLETSDGAVHTFDEVVLTTPLGWLKRNKSAFTPALPKRLSSAIDNISYGTLDKVYITFPEAFWSNTSSSPTTQKANGIDPRGTTPNVTAKTTPLHQTPSNDKQPHDPGFISWLQPAYAAKTNPSHWMQEGMNLAALRPDCAHPTLLFYVQGPQSTHIASLVASSPSQPELDATLTEYFEPYYSLLPHYDKADPACTPRAVLATAWANDKFAGHGSYSNFQIGLEKGDEDIEVMRRGLPERRVWFAGEHTAPFVALGTTTGAYWSGEAVAERIMRAYGALER